MYIHNFAREDSKGAFVELSDFSFDIGKILINFVKYDEHTQDWIYNSNLPRLQGIPRTCRGSPLRSHIQTHNRREK